MESVPRPCAHTSHAFGGLCSTKSHPCNPRRSSSADGPPDVFDADVKGDSRESRKLRQAIMMFRKMEESEKQASAPTPSTRRGRANSGSSKMDAGEKSGSRRGRPPGYGLLCAGYPGGVSKHGTGTFQHQCGGLCVIV